MQTAGLVLLDVALVLAVASAARVVLARLRQPPVMAEVLAGLVLGASLLAVPTFDGDARAVLAVLAEVAIARYLFLTAARLELGSLGAAVVGRVAVVSFIVPLAAGAVLALALHPFVETTPPLGAFALFVGTAMAVTALPVLARIVDSHGLRHQPAGRIALAAAAGQEVLVWPLLLVAVLLVDGSGPPSVVLVVAGSFAAGLITPARPRARIVSALEARPLVVMSAALLPLFFALPALRVELGSLGADGLGMLVAVLLVAVPAKLLSAGVASGSAQVGVLMNARGLVELVVLSVGLDAGLIDERLYAVMVLMALITTFATSPLLRRSAPRVTVRAPRGAQPL